MSMVTGDIADNMLLAMPFSHTNIAKSFGKVIGLQNPFSSTAKVATKFTIDNYKKRALGMYSKKVGKGLSFMAGKRALSVGSEIFLEENPQFIIDDKYKRDQLKENSSRFGSMIDMYSAASTGFQALFGMSGDDRYDSNKEYKDNAMHTLWSTIVMGSANLNTITDLSSVFSDANNTAFAEKIYR